MRAEQNSFIKKQSSVCLQIRMVCQYLFRIRHQTLSRECVCSHPVCDVLLRSAQCSMILYCLAFFLSLFCSSFSNIDISVFRYDHDYFPPLPLHLIVFPFLQIELHFICRHALYSWEYCVGVDCYASNSVCSGDGRHR